MDFRGHEGNYDFTEDRGEVGADHGGEVLQLFYDALEVLRHCFGVVGQLFYGLLGREGPDYLRGDGDYLALVGFYPICLLLVACKIILEPNTN